MTMDIALGEVIATREIEFVRRNGEKETVQISIGRPVAGQDEHEWHCPYLIQAKSFKHQFRMVGADSLQALVLTMTIIATELESLAKKHNGLFTQYGELELGLPQLKERGSKH